MRPKSLRELTEKAREELAPRDDERRRVYAALSAAVAAGAASAALGSASASAASTGVSTAANGAAAVGGGGAGTAGTGSAGAGASIGTGAGLSGGVVGSGVSGGALVSGGLASSGLGGAGLFLKGLLLVALVGGGAGLVAQVGGSDGALDMRIMEDGTGGDRELRGEASGAGVEAAGTHALGMRAGAFGAEGEHRPELGAQATSTGSRALPRRERSEPRGPAGRTSDARDSRAGELLANDALADDALANDALANDALADDALVNNALANDALGGETLESAARILQRAQQAIARGEGASALRLLAAGGVDPRLRAERLALRVLALCDIGDQRAAERDAAELRSLGLHSAALASIANSCVE